MAITRTTTVLRFGANGDQYTVDSDGLAANAFRQQITAVTFCTVGTAGVCKLTEKNDGSGGSIAEMTLKTNDGVLIGPGLDADFAGGLKFAGPSGSYALAYLSQED